MNTHPNSVASFKDRTEQSKMIDASFYRFLCPICKTSKSVAGRVSRGWKRGYKCADCAKAKSAA